MKKLFFAAAAIIMLLVSFVQPRADAIKANADGADVVYAYLPAAVMLYTKDEDGGYNPLTTLPPTYFVALLEDENSVSGYIRVNYADITGYVKKTEIEICDYEPVTKSAIGAASMSFDSQPVNLRQTPDHNKNDNIIFVIPADGKAEYYGTVEGTALFSQTGRTWYYVRVNTETGFLYGYIYSVQITVEKINTNTIEKVVKVTPDPLPDPDISEPPDALSETTVYIIIACLTVPAVLVMLLLFQKPSKAKRKPRHL